MATDVSQISEIISKDMEQEINEFKKGIESKSELLAFEIFSALKIPKEKVEKVTKKCKETRKNLWQEALRKANNDPKKAFSIYTQ